MANIAVRIDAKAHPSGEEFVQWGTEFFAYLVQVKSAHNPGLLRLIYCLGDDGRQQMALSVFNFLRPQLWNHFCNDRRLAKREAKKRISKARTDLQGARTAYLRLLTSFPELTLYRQLGHDRRFHLSDILEEEARFLAAQRKLERISARRRRDRRRRSQRTQVEQDHRLNNIRLLSAASAKLTRAAKSYRGLLTIDATITITIGHSYASFPPFELRSVLEEEDAYLKGIWNRADSAFVKKRLGMKANLGFLCRLQYFVEIFALRWGPYLRPETTTVLRESDVADLLEAGKSALGLPEKETETCAESIGRALERYTRNSKNSQTCQLLRQSAQEICDGLRLRPPSSPPSLHTPQV